MTHLGPRGHDITCLGRRVKEMGTAGTKGGGHAVKGMKDGSNRICAGPRRYRGIIGPSKDGVRDSYIIGHS